MLLSFGVRAHGSYLVLSLPGARVADVSDVTQRGEEVVTFWGASSAKQESHPRQQRASS